MFCFFYFFFLFRIILIYILILNNLFLLRSWPLFFWWLLLNNILICLNLRRRFFLWYQTIQFCFILIILWINLWLWFLKNFSGLCLGGFYFFGISFTPDNHLIKLTFYFLVCCNLPAQIFCFYFIYSVYSPV